MYSSLEDQGGVGQFGAVPLAPHLLVNGANILHAWPELRRLLTRDRDVAQRQSAKVAALRGTSEKAGRR